MQHRCDPQPTQPTLWHCFELFELRPVISPPLGAYPPPRTPTIDRPRYCNVCGSDSNVTLDAREFRQDRVLRWMIPVLSPPLAPDRPRAKNRRCLGEAITTSLNPHPHPRP
jgi:hypothetical protein